MDKLTRYNQKVLAVIGTLTIAILVVIIVAGLGVFIFTMWEDNSRDDTGIIVTNTQNAGTNPEISQGITFMAPYLLDSAQSLFLIPVSQVNLDALEKRGLRSGSGSKYYGYDYSYESHHGLFNNFVLYNHPENETKKIFGNKMAITEWTFLKINSVQVLFFSGATTDTNNDGKLNSDDYMGFYVYFLSDQKLLKFNFENKTVLDFEPLENTNLVVITLGSDLNKNFEFENNKEPKELLVFNANTRSVNDFISDDLKKEIQNIVDGK